MWVLLYVIEIENKISCFNFLWVFINVTLRILEVYYFVYIVTCLVKAWVAEPEKTSLLDISSVNTFPPQPHHTIAVADIHETIEQLLEVVFSTVRRLELSIGGECERVTVLG